MIYKCKENPVSLVYTTQNTVCHDISDPDSCDCEVKYGAFILVKLMLIVMHVNIHTSGHNDLNDTIERLVEKLIFIDNIGSDFR